MAAASAVGRRVLLAFPRSFCAGVERAIATVERALELCGPPVYVRRQIVHNSFVVEALEGGERSSSTRLTRCRTRRW